MSRIPVPSTSSAVPAAESSSSAINQLLKYTKQFTEISQLKQENELILEQLTFFQNFSEISAERNLANAVNGDFSESVSTNELVSRCFKFDVNVIPTKTAESIVEASVDLIYVKVENISKALAFHHKFWYFVVNFGGEADEKAATWNLNGVLKPGDKAVFSMRIELSDFKTKLIKISLVFNLNFRDEYFIRVFQVTDLPISISYFLNPTKILTTTANQCILKDPPNISSLADELNKGQSSNSNPSNRKLPSLTKFQINVNAKLDKMFVSLLFGDSSPRGFSKEVTEDIYKQLISSEEVPFFVGYEKIIVIRSIVGSGDGASKGNTRGRGDNPGHSHNKDAAAAGVIIIDDDVGDEDDGQIYSYTFRCYCLQLLLCLKVALLVKLLNVDGLKVRAPSDSNYEKLYQIKLKLESVRDDERRKNFEYELLEDYIVIRFLSEHICFAL